MRVRRSSMNYLSSSPSSSSSSSPLSSSNSSITTHCLASSTDSSSSVPSISCFTSSSVSRCDGLNLLVKAIHHVVAGSIVGVPYIQRRVIRRRRRAIRFNKLIVTELIEKEKPDEEVEEDADEGKNDVKKKAKSIIKRQRRREMAMPSKYQDSILQPWKPRSRRPQSNKIGDELSS